MLIDALRQALVSAHRPEATAELQPLADSGLAHWHLRLVGSGLLARIPKQSQLGLDAAAHLAYEAACFERAAASGHTPGLVAVLPPSAALPRGALLVHEVDGRPLRLPQDLPALVQALAALHALPLPAAPARAPLRDPADALADLAHEVDTQAAASTSSTVGTIITVETMAATCELWLDSHRFSMPTDSVWMPSRSAVA